MKNQTSIKEFYILVFSEKNSETILISILLSLLYLSGVLMNVIIVVSVYTNQNLKSPLYMFLCNLSCVDVCFTTSTIPNLLFISMSKNNQMSLIQCFSQMYFYYLSANAEEFLLVTMAYDRYVAICHPLHYHNILDRKTCTILVAVDWVTSALNSVIITNTASKMYFCKSHIVNQFFCDAKALTMIACSGVGDFYIAVFVEIFFVALPAFVCTLVSYIKIAGVIMKIKSWAGRRKAFSTCSSHLIVMTVYYGTAATAYLIPTSKYSNLCVGMLTVLYAVLTPMLNPLIYSLRNKELMRAIHKLLDSMKIKQGYTGYDNKH